jgi:hypothetical protein
LIGAVFAFPASAQDTPQVNVQDQVSTNGTVWIVSAFSSGPGFVVIHVDNNGSPGGVAGFKWLNPGWNFNIPIQIGGEESAELTPTLFAMLHVDDGTIGEYEFDGSSGLDNPVSDAAGNVITPSFNVNAYNASDQLVQNNTVTIESVTVPVNSFLVIHLDNNGTPGGVAGQTAVEPGTTNDVAITLSGDLTPVLWPMLHVDDGVVGTYEFDGSSGLDSPIVVNNVVATSSIWTIPHVRVSDQAVTPGDGQPAPSPITVQVDSVLSDGPGFLVIHVDNNGAPGGAAGFTAVSDGINKDIQVELNPDLVTPILWPMLHVDDGVVGTYEFDGQSGLDNPVFIDGEVLTFPINGVPSITYTGGITDDLRTVFVDAAVIDAPGWLALHVDNGSGQPGPVAGVAPLRVGLNENIRIPITDPSLITPNLFPMLHYDTGIAGTYEFDGQNGLDLPVFVGGNVIVGQLNTGGTTTSTDTTSSSGACTLTAANANGANIRGGPGTDAAVVGSLSSGQTATAIGQTPSGSFVWFQIAAGQWVRNDVVTTSGDCASLPVIEAEVVPASTESP